MTPEESEKVRELRQALQDARKALYECWVISGADTSGTVIREPDGHIRPGIDLLAIDGVKQLRHDYDDDSELSSLRGRVEQAEKALAEIARRCEVIKTGDIHGVPTWDEPFPAEIWGRARAAVSTAPEEQEKA